MTTGPAENIDYAIQCRIHLTMIYPHLNSTSRRTIWNGFLKYRSHNLLEKDFSELGEIELNGRQIKNVVKLGQLLSRKQQKLVDRAMLEIPR